MSVPEEPQMPDSGDTVAPSVGPDYPASPVSPPPASEEVAYASAYPGEAPPAVPARTEEPSPVVPTAEDPPTGIRGERLPAIPTSAEKPPVEASTDLPPASAEEPPPTGAETPTEAGDVLPTPLPLPPFPPYYPAQPNAPSQPYYPYPSQPYPPQPYPPQQYPSQPYYPAQQYPSQPYPPQPYYPSQPYYPAQPFSGAVAVATEQPAPPAQPADPRHLLARPLPFWAVLAATLGTLAVMVGIGATGSDWAEAGVRAGAVAALVALIVIVFTVIRLNVGLNAATNETRRAQLTGLSVVVALLLVAFAGGLGLQNPVHRVQAGVLNGQGQYQRSVDEWRLAGETPPGSVNLAQTYVDWGEHLLNQGNYDQAVARFETVQQTYPAAKAEVQRAQRDEVATYLAWGKANNTKGDYRNTILQMVLLSGLPYCADACQSQIPPIAAKAYYQLGTSQIAAKACTDAVASFKTLVALYPATTEAQQAAQQLQAPQAVTGDFGFSPPIPAGYTVTFILIPQISQTDTVAAVEKNIFASQLQVILTGRGTFTLPNVPQNSYNTAVTISVGGTLQLIAVLVDQSGASPIFFAATSMPLCATDLGDLSQLAAISLPLPTSTTATTNRLATPLFLNRTPQFTTHVTRDLFAEDQRG